MTHGQAQHVIAQVNAQLALGLPPPEERPITPSHEEVIQDLWAELDGDLARERDLADPPGYEWQRQWEPKGGDPI